MASRVGGSPSTSPTIGWMNALLVGLLVCSESVTMASSADAAAEVELDLPVTVALLLPSADDQGSGDPPLLDPATLQTTLEQTLATHQVPFFDGTQWVDSGLQYRVQWSLAATLPSNMLQEVEDALASDLHHRSGTLAAGAPSSVEKQAGGAAAAMSAADVAREGVRVSVSKVDTVLANVAASQFPGQTVLFVVAPRKAKVFGDNRLRRRRYHYNLKRNGHPCTGGNGGDSVAGGGDLAGNEGSSGSKCSGSGGDLGCAVAWVGSGRFLVVDLAAGPCEWGDDAGSSGLVGHNFPFVGDGTQAPRSSLEALGFHPASYLSTNGEEEDDDEDDDDTKVNSEAESGSGGSSGDGDKDEGEEESTTTFETKKAEARLRAHFSGPLLAGQIANLASSAVRSVLAPPVGSAQDQLHDGNARSGHHLAHVPSQVLVPVIVLSPRASAWGSLSASADEAFLARVFNSSAVESLIASAMPHPSSDEEQKVTVVAAAHGVSEHPSLGIVLAESLRSRTQHRRLPGHPKESIPEEPSFVTEEHTYVDSSVLQRILRDHHGDVLAHELLQDAGVFGSSGSSSSLSSMKASQARLQVEVALRDPHAFEKHTHRPNFSGDKSSSSSGDGGDGNSGGGLRVLPVFVLSDLAFSSPLIGGDGKAAPLAFDHGHLVSASADCVIVLHSSSSSNGDPSSNSHAMRVPLDHLVSRLGGAAGGGGDGGSTLSVDPTDATSAVASGVLAALTSVNPAPPFVSTASRASSRRSSSAGQRQSAAAGAAKSGSLSASPSSSSSSSSSIVDYTWAVGHHPFPPFGLLSQSATDSIGSGGGGSGGATGSKNVAASASSNMKGRGGSRGSSSTGSTSSSSSNNDAPSWNLSPLYGDGATRAAIAANVYAAREAMHGLSAALSTYEATVSHGLTHASTANLTTDSTYYAPQRSLRDAAASSNALPQSSSSAGSMVIPVPEVVLAASDSARDSLHACLESFKATKKLRVSATAATKAWQSEVAEQQEDLASLQQPQQEALAAQHPLTVDRGLSLALDGVLSLHRQSLAAYHKHIGVSTATTTLWPVLEEQGGGDRQARGELGLALSVWDACCDHAVHMGGEVSEWHPTRVFVGVLVVVGALLWCVGRSFRSYIRTSRKRRRLGLA